MFFFYGIFTHFDFFSFTTLISIIIFVFLAYLGFNETRKEIIINEDHVVIFSYFFNRRKIFYFNEIVYISYKEVLRHNILYVFLKDGSRFRFLIDNEWDEYIEEIKELLNEKGVEVKIDRS